LLRFFDEKVSAHFFGRAISQILRHANDYFFQVCLRAIEDFQKNVVIHKHEIVEYFCA
jgi:hypothetical protein